ncbi:hypothetical protein LEMLEM_LOCUS21783 [Lemmus lemmus]
MLPCLKSCPPWSSPEAHLPHAAGPHDMAAALPVLCSGSWCQTAF